MYLQSKDQAQKAVLEGPFTFQVCWPKQRTCVKLHVNIGFALSSLGCPLFKWRHYFCIQRSSHQDHKYCPWGTPGQSWLVWCLHHRQNYFLWGFNIWKFNNCYLTRKLFFQSSDAKPFMSTTEWAWKMKKLQILQQSISKHFLLATFLPRVLRACKLWTRMEMSWG